MVGEHHAGGDNLRITVGVGDHFSLVEILNRDVIGVIAELALRRQVGHFLHAGDHGLLVGHIAPRRLDAGVDQEWRVVGLGSEDRRVIAEFRDEILDEFFIRFCFTVSLFVIEDKTVLSFELS